MDFLSPLSGWWEGKEVGLLRGHPCVFVLLWNSVWGCVFGVARREIGVLGPSELLSCWSWASCFECHWASYIDSLGAFIMQPRAQAFYCGPTYYLCFANENFEIGEKKISFPRSHSIGNWFDSGRWPRLMWLDPDNCEPLCLSVRSTTGFWALLFVT